MVVRCYGLTLQGINISHLGKRKIIFKSDFWWDMLVPWRVSSHCSLSTFWFPRADRWLMVVVVYSSRSTPLRGRGEPASVLSPTFITNQLVDDHQQKISHVDHGNLLCKNKKTIFRPQKMGQMCIEHLSKSYPICQRTVRDNIEENGLLKCINIIN